MRMRQILVVEPVEIEAAHRRRLADEADASRLLLGTRRIFLDDLEAALAMLGVGDDVEGEEGHLLLGEAVFLEERRRRLAVDRRHLRFEANEETGERLGERPLRLAIAPALE